MFHRCHTTEFCAGTLKDKRSENVFPLSSLWSSRKPTSITPDPPCKEQTTKLRSWEEQQQDKYSQGELQVRNSRCHFEKELQKSWFVSRHRQVKRHESGLRDAPNPGGPRALIIIGSLRRAVLMHGSTTCTCLSKSLNRHVLKLSSKLVALTTVLGATFGNSAEDMIYSQHHTWWTAQPSMPVN